MGETSCQYNIQKAMLPFNCLVNVIYVLFSILLISFTFSNLGYATSIQATRQSCPDWIKNRKNMPLCPTSRDASILPETYPTGAVVVSSDSFNQSEAVSQQFTTSFVEQVIRSAQDENTQMPLILLMGVPESTQTYMRERINQLNISQKAKTEAFTALKPISAPPWTWQQDYWEAFATPEGEIYFRQIENYQHEEKFKKRPSSFSGFLSSFLSKPNTSDFFNNSNLEDCGFREGPLLLTTKSRSNSKLRRFLNIVELRSGHLGGNIEGLPGGFCLLGDDHFNGTEWENHANQFCGRRSSNRIKVPTNWLNVGHTDEVMKVFKNNNPKPGQCDFSIAISSPRQATRLLSQNAKAPFTSLKNKDHDMLQKLCEDVLILERAVRPLIIKPQRETSGFIKHLLMRSSHAQILPLIDAWIQRRSRRRICRNNQKNMTNSDVSKLLQGNHLLAKYNAKIQEEMDSFQILLTEKIKSRLKCTPDFIQSPDLFYASEPSLVESQDENGVIHQTLPRGSGISILPSSTNAVSVGNSLIISDPGGNAIFSEYMKGEYEKRGITARFVDTSLYAHTGGGNLHCATHTVHLCQPRPTTQRSQRKRQR